MSRTVCGICWCPYDDDTGACACEPELKAQHMTDLRTAAQQALEALENIDKEFRKHGRRHWPEAVKAHSAIAPLRAALAEPVQQGCDHCNHPLYAAVKCRVCGRVTEPVQEPVAWLVTDCIGERYLCFSPPLDNDQVLPLYAAPPQRKPLTDEEILNLFRNSGSPALFARAIEAKHGIGGAPEERNFCPRCGKRTQGIHTCTPPGDSDVYR